MRISDWSSDVCSSDLLDGGLRHVVECEHGADRRLIEEAPQLLVVVVIVEASTGEQHRAVEQLLLETRFVGNDRFLTDRTILTVSRRRNSWVAACLIALEIGRAP